jgi:hypothetical protein
MAVLPSPTFANIIDKFVKTSIALFLGDDGIFAKYQHRSLAKTVCNLFPPF